MSKDTKNFDSPSDEASFEASVLQQEEDFEKEEEEKFHYRTDEEYNTYDKDAEAERQEAEIEFEKEEDFNSLSEEDYNSLSKKKNKSKKKHNNDDGDGDGDVKKGNITPKSKNEPKNKTSLKINKPEQKVLKNNKRIIIAVPKELFKIKDISLLDKLIYAHIYYLDTKNEECYVGNEHLAETFDVALVTIKASLGKLEKEGFIIRKRKGRKRIIKSLYKLDMTKVYEL